MQCWGAQRYGSIQQEGGAPAGRAVPAGEIDVLQSALLRAEFLYYDFGWFLQRSGQNFILGVGHQGEKQAGGRQNIIWGTQMY